MENKKREVSDDIMEKANEVASQIGDYAELTRVWHDDDPTFVVSYNKMQFVGLPIVFYYRDGVFNFIRGYDCFHYLRDENDDEEENSNTDIQ